MSDLIDRAAAIDAMCDACSDWCDEGVCKKASAIQRLPSAQPVTIPSESSAVKLQDSNDTISRQATIDAVKRLSLGETDATRLAMRIGDYLKRLQSAQPAPRWIPCSERLPEYGVEVLTTLGMGDGFISIDTLERHVGGTHWENYHGDWTDLEAVIAWMPLPEPWEGGMT